MEEKTVNLTIRVNPRLKADAEVACAYLKRSFTQEIKKLLMDMVREHHTQRAKDTQTARTFIEGEVCLMAYAALQEKYEAAGHEMPEQVRQILTKRGESGD